MTMTVFIHPPDSWETFIVDVLHGTIVTQTHFWRYLQYHIRLFFFSMNAAAKQTPVLVFHAIQNTSQEISVKYLSQRYNDVMPNTGIEPATLRSLSRRFNQLSYAAAKQCCGRDLRAGHHD